MQKIVQFFKEAYSELKRVAWPSKDQTIHYTFLVIIISVSLAMVLGLLDILFSGFIRDFILS